MTSKKHHAAEAAAGYAAREAAQDTLREERSTLRAAAKEEKAIAEDAAQEAKAAAKEEKAAAKEAAKHKPKFKVGAKVTVQGHGVGEVVEVTEHDEHWFAAKQPQIYSVRLEAWEEEKYLDHSPDRPPQEQVRYRNKKTGEVRDHAADTLGGVFEDQLEMAK